MTTKLEGFQRSLSDKTTWGRIAAMGTRDGERWYMMVDKRGGVALQPAEVVENKDSRKQDA